MAVDKKITDLGAIPSVAVGDVLEIVDVSDTADGVAGSSKKTTITQLKTGLGVPATADTAATGLTATGTTQGTALALTTETSDVTTVAANTGVILPAYVQTGARFVVRNRGANTLKVYPPTGVAINALGANVAYSIPFGGTATFVWVSSTLLISVHQTVSWNAIGSFGANANGASWLDTGAINLEPASAAFGGVIAPIASSPQTIGTLLKQPAPAWNNFTTGIANPPSATGGALGLNWTTLASPQGAARYRLNAYGDLEVQISCQFVSAATAAWNAARSVIAVLPSGFRPTVKTRIGADSGLAGTNDKYASVDIDSVTGNITVVNNQQNASTITWIIFSVCIPMN